MPLGRSREGRWDRNTETLFDASKEVFLELITEKIKYMLLSRHQHAGQIYDIKIKEVF
jgi:hypothetical protein